MNVRPFAKIILVMFVSASALPSQADEPGRYRDALKTASDRWAIDANLLEALLQIESRFKPEARSHTGAVGLAQFTSIGCAEVRRLAALGPARRALPETLRQELLSFNKAEALDARLSIEAAALFLNHLLGLYAGDRAAALTHYNAGRRAALAVQRWGHEGARLRGELGASQAETYAPRVLAECSRLTSRLVAAPNRKS